MKNGFTLVEISIGLVIIGLLIGGVIVAKSMIHAAELRSVGEDFQKYLTSFQAFRLKYNCIPGDCERASSFGLGVNGNGDNRIPWTNEGMRAWVHLANAGMVEGTYTGAGNPGNRLTPGVNTPKSKIVGAGFAIGSTSHTPLNPLNYKDFSRIENFFLFGRESTASWYNAGALTPIDARSIDEKLDDGDPDSGSILAYGSFAIGAGTNSGCVLNNAPGTTYELTDPDLRCVLIMKID
ncbi:MAG: prepilin-type N-terminal cleavage/methylation domain-containing protein [Planctomycetaceae bacterium]|nr:prepilin-type N-terminal cleavage/methylation domain-containing protein [Planctomycetaceae bacterium]